MPGSPSRIRFVTVRDLYAVFPTAAVDVGIEANDEASQAFVERLAGKGEARAALSYCAYLLARREAIWWACCCVRQTALRQPYEVRCLEAAEAWVYEPNERLRLHALELAAHESKTVAATWIVQAVAWSGGNISSTIGYHIEPPAQGTGQAVRGAVLIAATGLGDRREAVQDEWIRMALRFASGDFNGA
ncbi:DUF6931 family protein [Beijerinckia mobilis]|uniref:DUF6931 family protein n=1 Tax=Beijerinckia mobilis TaxID=231434 RepID=UPI000690EFE9|nr:hypothetical protein [Beijerinckia mobilis]